MAVHDQMPKYNELMNPLLRALHDLGGSASVGELSSQVAETLDLPEEVLALPHGLDSNSQTELDYRLAWARTYLKKYGIIDNSVRGVWVIVPDKRDVTSVDPQTVVRTVREKTRERRQTQSTDQGVEGNVSIDDVEPPEDFASWRIKLHHVLTKEISHDAFERLVKRMLRESGFVQVDVTGRSGDGGIDGKGIVKVGGLLSFHVLFQCKKYQGSVSSPAIRDFRGALIGRADKGLFVTTGSFTRDAMREATRDGATPIDLIDGDELADKLKELGLGIETEMVESVSVDEDWFRSI